MKLNAGIANQSESGQWSPGLLLQRKCDCGNHTMSGSCDDCTKKNGLLQRKASSDFESSAVPGIVHEVLHSPGQPLDGRTRGFMESRLGQDFSRVRVHADAPAGESAAAVSAEAYTVRNHVVFGAGKYRPATDDGRHLIAHELVHVLQQGDGPMPSQMNLGSESSLLEHQAHRVSGDAMARSGSRTHNTPPGPEIRGS